MSNAQNVQAARLEAMLLLSQLHDPQLVYEVHGFVRHMAEEQADRDKKAVQEHD